jgi:hypothetical protein
MKFHEVVNKIEKQKSIKESGGITSIVPPFPRLAEEYGGFTKGSITCVTANSGVGKTKFIKYLCVISFLKTALANKIQPKIFYFALEESETDFWLSFISMYLYEKWKISISVKELLSIGKFTVSNDLMAKIKESEKFITRLQNYVEVIDYLRSPSRITQHVSRYFANPAIGTQHYAVEGEKKVPSEYKYKSDDLWVMGITDHLSLLANDIIPGGTKRMTPYETFDYFVKDCVLSNFSKRYQMINILVHQQTPASEKVLFTNKGSRIEEKLEPSLEELHINKGVQQDYETVIGLFNPSRYDIEVHNGYDISLLKNNYRSIKFLKDRHYGMENANVGLYFNGAVGNFEELPKAELMTTQHKYQEILEEKNNQKKSREAYLTL